MRSQLYAERLYKRMQKGTETKESKDDQDNHEPTGITACQTHELGVSGKKEKCKQRNGKQNGCKISRTHMLMLQWHDISPRKLPEDRR